MHGFDGAGSSEPPHVAQQRRRNKLRHDLNPNPNPNPNANQDFAFASSAPDMLDFSAGRGPSIPLLGPAACDWMDGGGNSSNYGEFCLEPYQNTLQDVVAPPPPPPPPRGLSLSLAASSPSPQLRAAGPLGPFTGYAAILKGSRFLKPAQQLLDELCSAVTGSRDAARGGLIGRNSGVPSSSFFSSIDGGSCEGPGVLGGGGASCDQVQRPEIQQKKVKLICLQEEVCRRYKQYHQQMQMVFSSFESVAGLSAATPYASLAVKSVSKHFRRIKNAISDQLHQVSKLLGEQLVSSPSSTSRGDTVMTSRLGFIDPVLRKQRGSENAGLGFLTNHQPVWRPQRGLPERAVSVLRAWLFEHFLHPYPTDTDKHMLATQTGLSRNQVSNWFINARVRLWKPMVEEIHNLESNGTTETNLSSANRNDGKSVMDAGRVHPYPDQLSEARSNRSLDCRTMGPLANEPNSSGIEHWHQDKRTRMEECSAVPQSIDGAGLMGLAYHGGMDLGGLGAVSLTLGLRHTEDPQQQQQIRHFGSRCQ